MSTTQSSNLPENADVRICACNWNDCSVLHNKLHSLIPEEESDKHPWTKTKFLTFKKDKTSPQYLAVRSAIIHHLHIPNDQSQSTFRVAPYHFHQNVLLNYKQRTILLSSDEAHQLDQENGKLNTIEQNVNKVHNRL